jgi:molybdenum cofactor guanylyltransferase
MLHVTGVILAGGQSSRMGENKALLPIGNKTVVECIAQALSEWTDSQIISAAEKETYLFTGLPVAVDLHPGEGPLAGLEAGMEKKQGDWYLAAACDMPLIRSEVIEYLVGKIKTTKYQAVLPIIHGRRQPLLAAYRADCLPVLKKCLSDGERSLKALFDKIDFDIITESDMIEAGIKKETVEASFFNMNHPEEYEKLLSWFDRQEES